MAMFATIVGWTPSRLRADVVIDHFAPSSLFEFTLGVNGVGQTFTAGDTALRDASFNLTSSPGGSRVFFNDAHLQVFSGSPQNFGPNADNALFTSARIDLAALPQTGTFADHPLYELKFSAFGMSELPLVPGQTYTIAVSNFGSTGDLFFAAHQPSVYPDGGRVSHLYAETPWRAPTTVEDVAFKVTMVPEPAAAAVAAFPLICALSFRRRPSGRQHGNEYTIRDAKYEQWLGSRSTVSAPTDRLTAGHQLM
jgi:hypothetical protein